jgi:cytochrome c oxidase subunit II
MSQEETRSPDEAPDRGGRSLAQMVGVGIIASALGIAIGVLIDWFPEQGSTQAEKIDTLWDVLVIASVPMFVLVTVVVGFSILDFRMRPGEDELDGPPIHGNTRLEIIWTALPALLIVGLCVYAYVVLTDIEEAPASQERVVRVTGQQFAWTFAYNEGGRKFNASQLYLPEGESVRFDITARDVIHDFWVPAFRMKLDAVPGITTSYRVTPKRTGRFPVVCAELCGIGHAYMRQTAHVLAPDEFAAWVRRASRSQQAGAGSAAAGAGQGEEAQGGEPGGDEGQGGEAPSGGLAAKTLFTAGNTQTGATACGACHALADAGTNAQTGPDLDESLKGKDAAYIERAIVEPNADIAQGFAEGIMPPNYGDTLSPEQVKALVDYLGRVTK